MTIPNQDSRAASPRGALLLLATALLLGLGTAAGQTAGVPSARLAAAAVALSVMGALGAQLVGRVRFRLPYFAKSAAFLLSVLLTGFVNGALTRPVLGPTVRETDDARVVGRVRKVEHLHWGRRALIDLSSLDGSPVSIGARLILPDDSPTFRPGDEISGRARMGPPEGPRNPGGYDPIPALARRRVHAVGRLHGASRTASGPMTRERRLDIARERVRAAVAEAAARASGEDDLEGRQRLEGVLRALSLGEGAAVPPEVRRDFATSGLAHLLAISGLHIGLVAAGLFALLRRLFLRLPWARHAGPLSAIAVAPVVGLLVAWVDHPPSAARAGLMALILLFAVVLRRRLCAWSSLSAVAIGLVVLQPGLVLRPGFQLSFAAVAGLLIIVQRDSRLAPGPSRLRRSLCRLRRMSEVTIAAALATAPLCALHFGIVPLLGNAANLVAVPLTGLLVPCVAVAATATLALGEAADAAWLVPAAGARVLIFVAQSAASIPLASAPVPAPGLLALLASGAGLWWSTRPGRLWRRLAAAVLVVLPLLLSGWLDGGEPPAGPLEVVFLSVGHGDATLIRAQAGDVLVDGGRGPASGLDAGRVHVVPALRALGVRRLSAVIVTHPHDDHYGGLGAVLEAFPTDEVFHNGSDYSEAGPYGALLARASELGAALRVACRDPLPELEPVILRCLHPRLGEQDGAVEALSQNDQSIVLAIELSDHRFLLAGDIEAEGEELLLARKADLTATVVKAPHHGSRGSSTPGFVATTCASHVVFSSAAPSNRFDFPAAEVVDRWRGHRTSLWWTHHHGALHFSSDGETLEVRPFRENAGTWPDR